MLLYLSIKAYCVCIHKIYETGKFLLHIAACIEASFVNYLQTMAAPTSAGSPLVTEAEVRTPTSFVKYIIAVNDLQTLGPSTTKKHCKELEKVRYQK